MLTIQKKIKSPSDWGKFLNILKTKGLNVRKMKNMYFIQKLDKLKYITVFLNFL